MEKERPLEARIAEAHDHFRKLGKEVLEQLKHINLKGEDMDRVSEEDFWKVGGRINEIMTSVEDFVAQLLRESKGDPNIMQSLHRNFVEPILQATEDRYMTIDSNGRLPAERYMESPAYSVAHMLENIAVKAVSEATSSKASKTRRTT